MLTGSTTVLTFILFVLLILLLNTSFDELLSKVPIPAGGTNCPLFSGIPPGKLLATGDHHY